MKKFLIKAISPDNSCQIKKIIDLFEESYGHDFNKGRLFNEDFWKRNVSRMFTSILAYKDGKLLAHIAFRKASGSSKDIELILPAFRAIDDQDFKELSHELFDFLSNIAKKQNWRLLYINSSLKFPFLQAFAFAGLGFQGFGILPNYFSNFEGLCAHNVILYQFFNLKENGACQNLVVPDSHYQISKYLCKGLPLKIYPASKSGVLTDNLLAEARAIETYRPNHSEKLHIYLQASLLVDPAREIDALIASAPSPLFFVSMKDQASAKICSLLADQDFSFSGICPFIKNNHYLVYSRYSKDSLSEDFLPSSRLQVLASYMLGKKQGFELEDSIIEPEQLDEVSNISLEL